MEITVFRTVSQQEMSLREIKLMSDFYLTTDIEKYRDTLESICKESSDYLMKVEGRPALSAFADVYETIPDLPKNFPVKCFAFIYKEEAVGYAWIVEDTEEGIFKDNNIRNYTSRAYKGMGLSNA
ncbi:MAG: hypothetical protein IKG30_07675 [Clostridiales bacterium]|nr:hypothetical protein [Clostridiales bacterium]